MKKIQTQLPPHIARWGREGESKASIPFPSKSKLIKYFLRFAPILDGFLCEGYFTLYSSAQLPPHTPIPFAKTVAFSPFSIVFRKRPYVCLACLRKKSRGKGESHLLYLAWTYFHSPFPQTERWNVFRKILISSRHWTNTIQGVREKKPMPFQSFKVTRVMEGEGKTHALFIEKGFFSWRVSSKI